MSGNSGLKALENALRYVAGTIDIRVDPFNFQDLHPVKSRGNQEVANTSIRTKDRAVKLHIEQNDRGNFRISLRSRLDAAHVVCVPAYAPHNPKEWFPDMHAAQNDRALHAELSRYDSDQSRDRIAMVLHVFMRAINPEFPSEALQPSLEWVAGQFPSRTAQHAPSLKQTGLKTASL